LDQVTPRVGKMLKAYEKSYIGVEEETTSVSWKDPLEWTQQIHWYARKEE
jgi:hypothetical protein